jgi:hypothetical protein
MPCRATVIRWLSRHEAFRAKYRHARDVQADVWAEEIRNLAMSEPPRNPVTGRYDPEAAKHLRRQVAWLQWLMMKLKPKQG